VFEQIWDCAAALSGRDDRPALRSIGKQAVAVPVMSEPWYCCAEPTRHQRDAY
jgi:hypothetical protein